MTHKELYRAAPSETAVRSGTYLGKRNESGSGVLVITSREVFSLRDKKVAAQELYDALQMFPVVSESLLRIPAFCAYVVFDHEWSHATAVPRDGIQFGITFKDGYPRGVATISRYFLPLPLEYRRATAPGWGGMMADDWMLARRVAEQFSSHPHPNWSLHGRELLAFLTRKEQEISRIRGTILHERGILPEDGLVVFPRGSHVPLVFDRREVR